MSANPEYGVQNAESKANNHASRFSFYVLRFLLTLLLWWCVAGASQAQAADVSTAFDQANRLYEQGKFAEAAASYGNILQSGQASAALYCNLGNALFNSGQIRPA